MKCPKCDNKMLFYAYLSYEFEEDDGNGGWWIGSLRGVAMNHYWACKKCRHVVDSTKVPSWLRGKQLDLSVPDKE